MSACSLCLVPHSLAFGQEASEPDRKFEQIENEISTKQSLRASKDRERADLRRQIAAVEEERDRLQVLHRTLEENLKQSEQTLSENTAKVRSYADLRDRKTTELVWNTVTSQQLKARNPLTMLIVQSDPLKVDRLYHYHRYFVKQLDIQISELEQHLVTLERLIVDARNSRLVFDSTERDYNANAEALQSRSTRLGALNRQLQTEIDALDRDLVQLVRERERLSQLIAARAPVVTHTGPAVTPASHGGMQNWPVVGEVRQRFGALRADGRIRSEGIVIEANQGEPITAIAGGTVLFAEWFEGYGNTMIIDHGDELIAIYAHCASLLKQATEPVEAGETIGTVGKGGSEDATGLYFEIRVRNEPTDPLRWFDSP
ncbi:MAG: peptidoglycan DD-metalloendopeptidase family protein [Gammaproteobacteria bacterium]|nr:peptidoglycan DD-metalloendopeptidase family protein [Gammaproteobacteria bacterium]